MEKKKERKWTHSQFSVKEYMSLITFFFPEYAKFEV